MSVPSASDLLVHLQPCPIQIDLAGRLFTIPALDAVAWVRLLLPVDTYEIFPALAGQEAIDLVEDMLWEGELTADGLARIALDVVSTAADRPWWTALGILTSAAQAWDRVHANNAAGVSLAGWLDQIWSNMVPYIDPKKFTAVQVNLATPPKGWEMEIDFDAEEAAWQAAMKAVA